MGTAVGRMAKRGGASFVVIAGAGAGACCDGDDGDGVAPGAANWRGVYQGSRSKSSAV